MGMIRDPLQDYLKIPLRDSHIPARGLKLPEQTYLRTLFRDGGYGDLIEVVRVYQLDI